MNKKNAIVSIVLIAVMCGFILPMQVKAFQTPVPPYGPSDTTWNYFGPTPTTLIMENLASQGTTFSALQSGTIDVMDSLLTPTQYSAVSSNPAITTGLVAQTEMVQYDMNNYVAPFNNTDYRLAFEFMMNKSEFIADYNPGGTPMYDPLDFNPFGQAAEAYCAALYPQADFLQAYKDLAASGFHLVAMNSTNGFGGAGQPGALNGYSTWFFQTPYPTVASTTHDGLGNSSSSYQLAVPNATIQIIARTEFADRENQAPFMNILCGSTTSDFTKFIEAYYASNPSFFTGIYALPTVGGVVQYPMINFLDTLMPKAGSSFEVMHYYRYQLYTGAWILDEFQDALEIWLSVEAPTSSVINWGPNALNYDFFNWDLSYDFNSSAGEPNFDYYTLQSLAAAIPGTGAGEQNWHNGSLYWAVLGQEELMRAAPLIPMYYYSGYSAVLTQDNFTINALGTGFDNWFTFMDAKTPSGTLTWGWSSDISNPNPISSTWAWDWDIMGPIYDSMIGANPYTLSVMPALATGYNVIPQDPNNPYSPANFAAVGTNASTAIMYLRTDSYWQDLPAMSRAIYTLDHGTELNGPITDQQVTPLDVAFTYEYLTHDSLYQSVHLASTIYDVGQCVVSSIYKSQWPWWNETAYPNGLPWENVTFINGPSEMNGTYPLTGPFSPWNFVSFSNTLAPNEIIIYFTDTTGWFAYYAELGIPIIPMYIWQHLAEASWPSSAWPTGTPSSFSMVLDPQGANLMFGSGPYIWTGFTTGTYTLKAYVSGASYGGVTEDTGYWAAQGRDTDLTTGTFAGVTIPPLPKSDYVDLYYKAYTHTAYVGETFTNWSMQPYYFGVQLSLIPYYYNTSAGWVAGPHLFGPTTYTTIGARATLPANYTAFVLSPPHGTQWVAFYYDSKVTIGPLTWIDQGWVTDHWPGYTGTVGWAMVNLAETPGDIAGGTMKAPYWGADGKVNIIDVGAVSSQWGHSVVGVMATAPDSALGIANTVGALTGTINILDIGPIATHFGSAYNWVIGTLPPTIPP